MAWGLSDKIQIVLFKELAKLGWLQAGKNNPVMVKNDMLFVYHNGENQENQVISFDYSEEEPNITNCRPVLLNPANCSWHLEKFGWLIDKGQLSSSVADLFDATDWNEWPGARDILYKCITQVDDLANKSDIALKAHKQHLVEKTTDKVVKEVIDTDQIIELGSYFQVCVVGLQVPLEPDKVYYVAEFTDGGVLVKTLTNSLNNFRKNGDMLLPAEFFLNLVSNKYIKGCKVDQNIVASSEMVWSPLVESSSVDFPQDLLYLNIDKDKQLIVAEAFHKNYNITPLLNPELDKDTVKLIGSFGEDVDISMFTNVNVDRDAAFELLTLAKEGYCINSLLSSGYSGEYIKAIFEESYSELSAKEKKLRNLGFSEEQIKTLIHFAFDGIDTSFMEKTKYSGQMMHLLWYTQQYPELEPLKQLFVSKAFVRSELYVPADFLDGEELACLRKMFYTTLDLSIKGVAWSDFMNKTFENLRYVYYTERYGFLLNANTYNVGFEKNSFLITGVDMKPQWRATLINERFVVNDENEDIITF